MKDYGKISIIIPVYHVENYIKESLQSIINQTYENFQIILIDDGSNDQSIEIAKKLLLNTTKEYKIIHQENQGLSAARNTGIANADGDYICFIDADDIIESKHLERLITWMNSQDLAMAFSGFEYTNMKNRAGQDVTDDLALVMSVEEMQLLFSRKKIPFHAGALLLDKKLLQENGGFCDDLRFGEDVEFVWRLLTRVQKVGRIMSESYKYLIRPNSIMTSLSMEKMIHFTEIMKNTLDTLVSGGKLDGQIAKVAYHRNVFAVYRTSARRMSYADFIKLLQKTNAKEKLVYLTKFPDYRVKVLAWLCRVHPRMGFIAFRMT